MAKTFRRLKQLLGRNLARTIIVIGMAVVGSTLLIISHAATPTSSLEPENATASGGVTTGTSAGASGGSYIQFGSKPTGSCTISATLVNSCRPWLGADAAGYPQAAANKKAQILYHEQRIGTQVDIAHYYFTAGQTLNSDAGDDPLYFVDRPGTYLYANWKPANTWSDASGGNASVNSQIKAMADSIKAQAPHKIFLTLYHEPENNVAAASESCAIQGTNSNGVAGTPADYVAMWHNVRSIFNADGVNNVVWVMNYMGFAGYNCMVKDLWPGNSYVDWITWDPYTSGATTWVDRTSAFYDFLSANSNSTDNFLSKPWGLAEFGVKTMTTVQQAAFYDDAAAAVTANTFPNLKMYLVYDSSGGTGDHRVSYDSATSTFDAAQQQHYNNFVNAVLNHKP